MHVLATAGHVDHGKSTLIRALTGSDPDRLAEEKRRGLTIELGFAWTTIDGAGEVAFVDVPGHQKFLSTTLAGLGPVPAVLFVVAADEGWRRQSAEHLAALDALDVRHGLIVITRCDLADAGPAAEAAARECAGTSLEGSPWVAVSAADGTGMAELRAAIARLIASLPEPEPPVRQRLWLDRVFTMTGTGTVVTGTLGAGRISVDDTLELNGAAVIVRGIESLGVKRETALGTARVAVALRGVDRAVISRGDALLTPGAWQPTRVVDVRLVTSVELPRQVILHVGTAAVPVIARRLSDTHLRLVLEHTLPLAAGDRALLRDPGRQQIAAGIVVVDTDPPAFTRRGAAARRATELRAKGDTADAVGEVTRRPFTTPAELAGLGIEIDPLPPGLILLDGRLLTLEQHRVSGLKLLEAVGEAVSGTPLETLRNRLELPTGGVLRALLAETPRLRLTPSGRIIDTEIPVIPEHLGDACERLARRWAADPFDAPTAEDLREHGLDNRALGQLHDLGVVVRLSDAVVVAPEAVSAALRILRGLPAPFTVSAARTALGSSRRVTLPLLGHLDGLRLTIRGADDRRRCA